MPRGKLNHCRVCGGPLYANPEGLARCEFHYRKYFADAMKRQYRKQQARRAAEMAAAYDRLNVAGLLNRRAS